jgi:TldD protein
MKPSDPTLDRLAAARKLLLDPYGLDEARLQTALASIFEHRADYADLYFQYTRSESYSLEEGIVKSGSFDIEQGVGVRAVAGDKTAFAYSDDISFEALNEAAVSARAIARHGAGRAKVAPKVMPRAQPALYGAHDPVASLDAAQKIRLLETVERLARARDRRVKQVMANLGAEYDVVLVARSDGVLAADVRPLVRLSVTVIVEEGGRGAPGE